VHDAQPTNTKAAAATYGKSRRANSRLSTCAQHWRAAYRHSYFLCNMCI